MMPRTWPSFSPVAAATRPRAPVIERRLALGSHPRSTSTLRNETGMDLQAASELFGHHGLIPSAVHYLA
ncbi:hypothetical protein PXNS11_310333 [Stutzerimonas xanthomarina]|nr:hypothetical protein PXNS11_310333 [Stutzerimonas xanthomarina]